jgi:negative regulator of flagellin synthesis FlgM
MHLEVHVPAQVSGYRAVRVAGESRMKIAAADVRPVGSPALVERVQAKPTVAGPQASTAVSLNASEQALARAKAEPAFDADKVQAMREAIASGRFEINAGAIADRLIANAQELLGRGGNVR